ncbi:ArnT family glycosyltransferase [Labrys wisconsinensis]|uniref:4-amino-4-deoxy-L-arabinose transferase-like glycosyltransferase n=1 Tax=Labrys wisconsinensis TaxID=425677 RepID=A0ABU0J346_9HYPH|nr:glycosyltransferase family 39 protein [Labrys wisconsinensis]MDQ0468686.1 4-amino-4-deoxy-L-arabinose transferase-like glycosyltransferase [Labrys wisconsinensis]
MTTSGETVGIAASGPDSGWFGRAFARIATSNRLSAFVLLLLAALAFAPGFATMPPMDRDEPRFAQASKQMLETGDFVSIRFQDEARLKKPVGIYWLQAGAVAVGEALGVPEARTTIALYRVPSLLAAFAAVLLTWWTALPLVGRRAALLAGLAMAASIMLGVEARLAKTDATLLATVLAMAGALARVYMAGRRGGPGGGTPLATAAVFWTAMAASILIKGPIGPMVIGLTIAGIVATTRDWRWLKDLRWLAGLAWTLVLVSPWFVAIMVETGGRFLQQSVGNDMMAKVAGGQESHGAPPGLYLALVWATFWPAAPLAALAAPWVWRHRREPQVLFLLSWLVPSWLLFEAVPTKLPHYVLPLYPALAMLIGAAIAEDGLARGLWGRLVALLVPVLALVAPAAALILIRHYEGAIAWAVLPFGLAAVAAAVLAWLLLGRGRAAEGLALSAVAAVLVYWGVYWAGMPALPTLWPSPRLAAAAKTLDCADPAFASAGFREPSLVFLVGTALAMPDGAGAADFLGAGGCRMAFVEKRQEVAFLAEATARGAKVALTGRITGLNINGGRELDIGVFRAAP